MHLTTEKELKHMTELTTIDTNNYAEMAKAMGIANEASSQTKQGIFLARLRLNHSPILGWVLMMMNLRSIFGKITSSLSVVTSD